MPIRLSVVCVLALVASELRAAAESNTDDLRPGLVATFRDAAGRQVVRLEPTVAVALAKGEASHPRLSADGGTIRWRGQIKALQAGEYRFAATLRGRLRVTVAGREVFAGEVTGEKPVLREAPAVTLEAGSLPFEVEFTRLPGAARAELFWQGPGFRREPLPYDVCFHRHDSAPPELLRDARIDFGRFLAEERGCVNCHANLDPAKRLVVRKGPELTNVGQRAYAGWIGRWLADPAKLRPGTAMPKLFTDDDAGRAERYAISRYLASLGGPVRRARPTRDARELRRSAERGQALFISTGCVVCHPAGPAKEEKADNAAVYGFPGQGVKSAYPLGAVGSKTSPGALARYLADPLAVNPLGRMPNMVLQGNEAADLARFLCSTVDESIPKDLTPEPPAEAFGEVWQRVTGKPGDPDPQRWLTLGRELLFMKGCVNCHELKTADNRGQAVVAFNAEIKAGRRYDSGCLADRRAKAGAAPWYDFRPAERDALRDFVAAGRDGANSPAPAYAARAALRRFNCLACHQRDGEGGLSPELVEELRRYERAENAEAISPPTLTGIGHKLLTPWLKGLLTEARRARPWMGLRMPQFGAANVGFLPDALAALEGSEPDATPHRSAFTSAKAAAGRILVGKNGFGCVSCHDIAGVPNTGTRGPDLTIGPQWLRYDWYQRWLEQPQRMQPGTRMPQVFTDGKSVLTGVLGGHADAQADAIWAYCSLGPNLPLPDGLEPPRGLTLTVTDRPVLLRTFMPEAGSRAVAVGYRGGVSVAFDAAACRLAYAWSGNFLDVAPVWANRGGAPAKPLGPRLWTAPAGQPWGLGSLPPEYAERAKDPAYGAAPPEGQVYAGPRAVHFEGYTADAGGLTTFRYRVGTGSGAGLHVSERPEPLRSPAAVGLARHLSVTIPAGQTGWLLAGDSSQPPRVFDGTQLRTVGDASADVPARGRLLVLQQPDGKTVALTLAAGQPSTHWRVQQVAAGWQVLVQLPATADERARDLSVRVWAVPSDEPDILRALAPGQ